MRIQIKKVYYCDFCKKKGLSLHAMRSHELHCTLNPARECRLCDLLQTRNDIPALVAKYKALIIRDEYEARLPDDQYKNLKQDVEGCPNCQLSVFRLIGVKYRSDVWDYKKALAEAWADINTTRWENVGL